MILLLTGPLGVGKTDTAWALLERFERAAMLDIDHVCAIQPFDPHDQAILDYVYQTAQVVAAHHYAHGIRDLVVNWVLETPDQLDRLEAALAAAFPEPLHRFTLRADPDVLAARIRQRNRPALDAEIRRTREVAALMDAAPAHMGTVLDTSALTLDEVVAQIWDQVRG